MEINHRVKLVRQSHSKHSKYTDAHLELTISPLTYNDKQVCI